MCLILPSSSLILLTEDKQTFDGMLGQERMGFIRSLGNDETDRPSEGWRRKVHH